MNATGRRMPLRGLLTVVAVWALVGCGGDNDAAPVSGMSGDPRLCLEDAGLASVEGRGSGTWRGAHALLGYFVIVQEHATSAQARELVTDATGTFAAHTGRYSVIGPAKPSAGGLLDPDEAAQAQDLVEEIAACLSPA